MKIVERDRHVDLRDESADPEKCLLESLRQLLQTGFATESDPQRKLNAAIVLMAVEQWMKQRKTLPVDELPCYCNWLSEREGLSPCYSISTTIQEKAEGKKNAYLAELTKDCVNSLRPAEGQPNYGYRLPTEAEMEYVTRAGAKTARCYGESAELLARYGWYGDNGGDGTWPVGVLKPNDLGFFDVHGNCYTWCVDRHQSYTEFGRSELAADGMPVTEDHDQQWYGPAADGERIARGGTAHFDRPNDVRCAYRYERAPDSEKYFFSFRIAQTIAVAPSGE